MGTGTGRVVSRTSSMAGKPVNGAAEKPDAEAASGASADAGSETVAGSAGPEAAPPKTSRRRRNQPASKTSAAGKSRAKKAKPPTQEDFARVGEISHIAHNGGKDSIPPEELVESYRVLVAAWDRVYGIV